MASITSANAVLMMSVNSIYSTPVQIQGFSADDVFDVEPLQSAEVLMGVDGIQSGGFVYVSVKQSIALQADSASNVVFDTWWAQQQARGDIYYAKHTNSNRRLWIGF